MGFGTTHFDQLEEESLEESQPWNKLEPVEFIM